MRGRSKLAILLLALGAIIALALPSAASASTGGHSAVKSASYTVVQVNPTTYTNVLSKKVPAVPMRAGNWIIRTRSCTSTCYEVTSQGNGLTMKIEATGFSTFNKSNPSGSQGTVYTTPNGYCVHGTNDSLVTASTNCGGSNTASQWQTNGAGELVNVAYGGFMGENSLGNDVTVRIEPTSGAYYNTPVNIG